MYEWEHHVRFAMRMERRGEMGVGSEKRGREVFFFF